MKSLIISMFLAHLFVVSTHYAHASEQLPPQVVILQYHHVATNTPAATSVAPDIFKQHMQYIKKHHQVFSLKDALDAIKNNRSLPANAITITFDDGYKNILENAHPILLEYGFPYTVFINPSSINSLGDQLTWDQVNQMRPLADFANHTLDHLHLLQRKPSENQSQWLARVMDNIETAEQKLAQRLGYSYKWLAYPYGEFNDSLQTALSDAGYLAFGQQSGALNKHSKMTAIPRFPAAGQYANLETLKVKMSAIAMPVLNHHPHGNQRSVGERMPTLKLTLHEQHSDMNKSQLACYFRGNRIVPSINNADIEVSVDHTFTPGRIRVNCTAPSNSMKGRFYWHSIAFFTPTENGIFLD